MSRAIIIISFSFLFLTVSLNGISQSFKNQIENSIEAIFQLSRIRQLNKAQNKLDSLESSLNPTQKDTFSPEIHWLEAVIFFEKYQFENALEKLGFARMLHEDKGPTETLGHIYLYIGRVYKDGFSNSSQAIFFYKKAEEVYLKSKNNSENIAQLNFQLARAYPFSDLEKRGYYNGLALEYYEKSPDKYAIELAECYNLEALRLSFRDGTTPEVEKSLLRLIDAVKTLDSQSRINLGKYYDNLGFILSKKNRPESIQYLKLGLKENEKNESNLYWVASSLNNIASFYRDKNQPDVALRYMKKVLASKIKLFGEMHPETSIAYQHIADLYLLKKQSDSSLYYLQKALFRSTTDYGNFTARELRASSRNHYLQSFAYIISQRSKLLQNKAHQDPKNIFLKNALTSLQSIDTLLTEAYQSFDWETSKITYTKDLKSFYLTYLDICYMLYMKTKKKEYAFHALNIMEGLRYKSALENQRTIRQSYSDATLTKHITKELKLKYELFHYLMLQKHSKKTQYRKEALSISKKYFMLRDSMKSLSTTNTKKQSILNKIDNLNIEKKLRNDVLEFQEGADFFYAIYITNTAIDFIRITKPGEWDSVLNNYTKSIRSLDLNSFNSQRSEFVNNGSFLYKLLLHPFDPYIKNSKHLTVIPDGSLNYIPFDILLKNRIGSNSYKTMEYLFKSVTISYALSLTLLLETNKMSGISSVLAFGLTEGPLTLPSALQEIESIKSNFQSKIYTGKDCSVKNFVSESPSFELTHLAVHGEQDTTNYLRSRLIFAPGDTLFEFYLYQMKFNQSAFILSACETGLGKKHDGEGIFSLSRAFLLAGAGSVVVTQWKMPDNQLSEIFDHFYKKLSNHHSINRALHESKMFYLNNADEYNAHPYFWAGINLVGKDSKMKEEKIYSISLLFIFAIIPAILLTFYFCNNRYHH